MDVDGGSGAVCGSEDSVCAGEGEEIHGSLHSPQLRYL